jgi:hypothetical protein
MDMCLHRGGLRYRLSHHELQRVVPAQETRLDVTLDLHLALVDGQPTIVHEPSRLVQLAAQQDAGHPERQDQQRQDGPAQQLTRLQHLAAPLFYAVIGANGDMLAAVAADHIEIASPESDVGQDHRLSVNFILNRLAP